MGQPEVAFQVLEDLAGNPALAHRARAVSRSRTPAIDLLREDYRYASTVRRSSRVACAPVDLVAQALPAYGAAPRHPTSPGTSASVSMHLLFAPGRRITPKTRSLIEFEGSGSTAETYLGVIGLREQRRVAHTAEEFEGFS
jgi:hypothetical protein